MNINYHNNRKKELLETVQYESGGLLKIYSDGTKNYIPSPRYTEKVERVKSYQSSVNKSFLNIKHNRNKLLFDRKICISGDRLIDKIFNTTTKFDFTNTKLKKK